MLENKPQFVLKVGTDIVSIPRIEKLITKFGNKFLEKVLQAEEISYCYKNNQLNINSVAKRFAGKEALSKAVGTGFGKELAFSDILIVNNSNNKPNISVNNKIAKYINSNFMLNNFDFDISLSDDCNFAIAVVTLFGYNV